MIKKTFRSALAATVAVLTFAGTAQAQELVTNGGFEQPGVTGSCCTTTPPDNLPGWTVTGGDVNVVTGSFNSGSGNRAYAGSQYLDLIGQINGGTTTLSQTLTTVANRIYNLTFAYSNNAFGGPTSRTASFVAGGLTGSVTHSTATPSNLNWTVFHGSFTATGTQTTLSFTESDGAGNAGVLLDGVSVYAVPEPATWAMMIAGFGMVGGMARRRRRTPAFA